MGQRTKVIETDGPTAKFLYAIIRQLDIKTVDWNRVSEEVGISNGHAARMRYSRFRQQMDGTASKPRNKKKNSKKGEKIELVAEPQMFMPQPPYPGMLPKLEPMDPSFSSHAFVKSEFAPQLSQSMPEIPSDWFPMMPPYDAHLQPGMSHPTCPPMPFLMAPGMHSSALTGGSMDLQNSPMGMSPGYNMGELSGQSPILEFDRQMPWSQQHTSSGHCSPVEVKKEPETVISDDEVFIKVEKPQDE
ncbi:hypothetical protein NUU61_001063 [Penicillium alfredii]|uniref:Myb-like DNA-binding domain-containing protein n=1 Tax=Penicillium alfredii TaxID=1506179 RepID=A0A9W9KQB2_9EURO|nr:uncharacterized protein NUU61_001063 [Penicillium alfredii]KAJ5115304.1 hypothetical protein NUU61_001063 [Penicillium alfredii]